MVATKKSARPLEAIVAKLVARVEALEATLTEAPALPAISPVDVGLIDVLRDRKGGPYEDGETRGAVIYGGAVSVGEREYLWEMERPVPGLLDLPMEDIANTLGVLASPARLTLATALLDGPKTSGQLQQALGVSSPGQLYHHLKGLLSLGVVEQAKRSSYQLAARHVVPLLTIIAAAVDVGGRPRPT